MRTIDYFFHTDFTSEAAILKDVPVGEINEDNQVLLASVLASLDKGEVASLWNHGGSFTHSLAKATVVSNGLNSQSQPTKSIFSHVLVLAFNDEKYEPFGNFYLQYNLPEEVPVTQPQTDTTTVYQSNSAFNSEPATVPTTEGTETQIVTEQPAEGSSDTTQSE